MTIQNMLDAVEWSPVDPPKDTSGLPYITHCGALRFGGVNLRVYQLSNGIRVIDENDMNALLGVKDEG